MRETVQIGQGFVLYRVVVMVVDTDNYLRPEVDVQKYQLLDLGRWEYLYSVDSNFVAIADKSVGGRWRCSMLGRRMLDLVERLVNYSTVDWPVVADLDCQIFDSDRLNDRHHMNSMADYMSPDCNCYHGYLNYQMDLRVYCRGLDSNLHLH